MKIILEDRRNGKTHQLIRLSHETGDIIIATTLRHKQSILRLAKQMMLEIPEPVIYSFGLPELRGKVFRGVLIDDADQLLKKIIQEPIHAISITKDNANHVQE